MWYAAGLVILTAALLTVLVLLVVRGRAERRRYDAEIAGYQRAPRHAASSPRRDDWQAGGFKPRPSAGEGMPTHPRHVECAPGPRGEVWAAGEGRRPRENSTRRPGDWYRRVDAVTADRIRPVIVPPPVTELRPPQPARDSGTGTGMMPALTDTGELAAITNEFNHKLIADNTQWLRERGFI